MASVAGVLLAIIGLWGMTMVALRGIAKSDQPISLTADSADSEQNSERRRHALDLQDRQAPRAFFRARDWARAWWILHPLSP